MHELPGRVACCCSATDAACHWIASAWPRLRPHIREAILTLIDADLNERWVNDEGSAARVSAEAGDSPDLESLLLALPPACRGTLLQDAVSFDAVGTIDDAFDAGPIRAAFAEFWQRASGYPVPIQKLRALLKPPVPTSTAVRFSEFAFTRDRDETSLALANLIQHLQERLVANLPASSESCRADCFEHLDLQ